VPRQCCDVCTSNQPTKQKHVKQGIFDNDHAPIIFIHAYSHVFVEVDELTYNAGLNIWSCHQVWFYGRQNKHVMSEHTLHAGAENQSWEQWAAAQADVHSLDSFCFSVPPTRPASAQSPYSPGRRGVTHIRPSSAAPHTPQARPRTPQLWSRLTDSQQDVPDHKGCAGSTQPGAAADADCAAATTASLHSIDEELGALSNAAGEQTAQSKLVTRRSKSALGARPNSAAARKRQTKTAPGAADDSSTGQTEASAAAAKPAAATRARPFSAQPQAKSPGSFLRNARPQSAAAANVGNHARPRSPAAGLNNFNEPKQESGWVDFRAQTRMAKRVSAHPPLEALLQAYLPVPRA